MRGRRRCKTSLEEERKDRGLGLKKKRKMGCVLMIGSLDVKKWRDEREMFGSG